MDFNLLTTCNIIIMKHGPLTLQSLLDKIKIDERNNPLLGIDWFLHHHLLEQDQETTIITIPDKIPI